MRKTFVTSLLLAALAAAPAFAQTPAPNGPQNPAQVPPPVYTDPATVTPGSKAVARRITMLVEDLEKSKRFYEALGFKEDRRSEVKDPADTAVFGLEPGTELTFIRMTMDNTLSTGRIDGGTLGLAQVKNKPLKKLRDVTKGETMIGTPILVMTTDGADAVHARLKAIGAEILSPPSPTPNGGRTMILRDPNGTRMEIYEPGRPVR
jgi:catechol 2,3-dioxygenase-like lactoylglutathione lyase family enzyme